MPLSGSGQSSLTTPERARLVAHVDAHNAEALSLLERAVNINSGTQNFAGVRAGGQAVRAPSSRRWASRRAGSTARRSSAPGTSSPSARGRASDSSSSAISTRSSNPTARSRSSSGSTTDTARGPGVIDMKGGDVIIVQALKALKAAGALDAHERHGRDDRRRRGVRRSAGRRARGARRRGQGRRASPSASRTAPAIRGHAVIGAPRHDGVDADGHGQAGALVADLPRRHRLRRHLRGGAHPQRVPRHAGRGAAPHVQSRRSWSAARKVELDADAGTRLRVRQGQRHRRARRRLGRPAHAVAGAVRAGAQDDGGDRRVVIAARRRRATITFDEGYPPLAPTDGNREAARALRSGEPRRRRWDP